MLREGATLDSDGSRISQTGKHAVGEQIYDVIVNEE